MARTYWVIAKSNEDATHARECGTKRQTEKTAALINGTTNGPRVAVYRVTVSAVKEATKP